MSDEQVKGAGRSRLAPLLALLPELVLGVASDDLKIAYVHAVNGAIGPRSYKRPEPDTDWSVATSDECELALVFFWRADYMGSWNGYSALDDGITSGTIARAVRRLEELAKPPCPACGSPDVIRIVYGEPPPALGEAEARGELVIGECLVGPDNPTEHCKACGHEFGRLADVEPGMFKERNDG